MILTGNLIALAIAGLAYILVKVTISFIKKFKKKKSSQIVMANMKDMIKNIPYKEKRTYSFEELEKIEDEVVMAEYDEYSDKLVQAEFVGDEGMDNKLENALKCNGGIIVIED